MIDNIGNILSKRAEIDPDKEGFVDVHAGLRLSFREHNARANRCADALARLGIEKGDRVAILMANSAEYMEIFYALAKLGAICVPLNWRLAVAELEYILGHSGSTVLIFGSDHAASAAAIERGRAPGVRVSSFVYCGHGQPPLSDAHDFRALRDRASAVEPARAAGGDDPLFIMYTSGTTGRPKGAVHTHGTVLWAMITQAASEEVRREDRFITVMPMYHVGALVPVIFGAYMGFTIVSVKEFQPSQYWRLIESEKVTVTLMVAAMVAALLHVPEKDSCDHSSLRWTMIGAAPVPPPMIVALEAMGIKVHQVYGLTETCGPACLITGDEALRRTGSTGKGFFHTDVRVVDAHGRDIRPGEVGEVIVSAKHNMKEYWNDPKATADAVKDGWLHTGDAARVDGDRFIYIVDRIKDMIISGGENVYPAEVEGVIASHPGVKEVGVVGVPDERWGEVPVAFIVKADRALSAESVLDHLSSRLAKYKTPKKIEFVDALPRNPSGKILKRDLRDLAGREL
ncbi:MAG: long-chain fatty acid--CoA ligase [Alphaproteobacteria bacterium]|nr:long-chain fatty acid--CoA ligase [Alphaproteobacteria bacterium]